MIYTALVICLEENTLWAGQTSLEVLYGSVVTSSIPCQAYIPTVSSCLNETDSSTVFVYLINGDAFTIYVTCMSHNNLRSNKVYSRAVPCHAGLFRTVPSSCERGISVCMHGKQ